MTEDDVLKELTPLELGALCSNLAKACDKQLRTEEASLFSKLADYYSGQSETPLSPDFNRLAALMESELAEGYPEGNAAAAAVSDRGAMRALVWGEKVTKLLKNLLSRYAKAGDSLVDSTGVWVCEVCGFVFVGDEPPGICPICKAPRSRIILVQKEAV